MADVARASRVSFEAIEHWESGESSPHPSQLTALAEALELDAGRLLAIQQGLSAPAPQPREGAGPIRYVMLTGQMGGYPVHAYLFFREGAPDAVLVDTGYEPIHALEAVMQRRLILRWLVLTHCHRDHMEGAAFLKAQTGARVAVPDVEWATYRAHQRENPDLPVSASSHIEVGPDLSLRAIATPGHTPGGTSYIIDGLCCVGDALFAGSTGRSMSPTGYSTLLSSLRQHVLSLPPETLLLPGHGPITTVGEERKNNPFFPTS